MGVKQFVINTDANATQLLSFIEKYPRLFYALSFSNQKCDLKIRAKAPKNGKPSNKENDEPKANFCALKTNDKSVIEDLFFDFPDFKEINIKHTLNISSVILAEGVSDPIQIREMAKKKGKIIREVKIDGRIEKLEKEFEA